MAGLDVLLGAHGGKGRRLKFGVGLSWLSNVIESNSNPIGNKAMLGDQVQEFIRRFN